MMIMRYLRLLPLLLFSAPLLLGADPPTVAIMDFVNHTGSEGLAYLSDSLPEALSASMSNVKEIQVVERRQLHQVLAEIELEMSDLFDEGEASRIGRLAEADVLLLGSYSGNPEQMVLSLKAVEVDSAKVLTARIVKAPLGKLFDQAHQAGLLLGTIIAGKDVGALSVSTRPNGAEVYVDGLMVGRSPLVEYKLVAGVHRLRAVRTGYLDEETTVTIEPNKLEVWQPALIAQETKDHGEVGLSVVYFSSLKKELKPAPLVRASLGYTFDRWLIAADVGFSRIIHGEVIDTPFGDITQDRWYIYLNAGLGLSYVVSDASRFIKPYVGAFGGWAMLNDMRRNKTFEGGKEKLRSQNLWNLGVKAGFLLAPFSRVSLFVEGRFAYSPVELIRDEYESQGLVGELVTEESQFNFNAYSVGGGIKIYL